MKTSQLMLVVFIIIILFISIFKIMTSSSQKQNDLKSIESPEVVIIENCQYFKIPAYAFTYTLTHKGNCTNHLHAKLSP